MTGQKRDAIKGYFCNCMMLICWSVKDDLGWSKVVNVLSVEALECHFPTKYYIHLVCGDGSSMFMTLLYKK